MPWMSRLPPRSGATRSGRSAGFARGQLEEPSSQSVVRLVAGAMGDDEALEVKPHESQIAEQVEQLVAGTFVWKAQRVSDRTFATEDQEIRRGSPEADARCTKSICLALGDEGPAGSNLSLERLGRESHAIAVSGDRGVRAIIEMVCQSERPGSAGIGDERGFSLADDHRAFELKHLAHPVLLDDAGCFDGFDKGPARAVAARALRGVDLDDAVVDAAPGQGGQHVFGHFHGGVALSERGPARRRDDSIDAVPG